MKKRGYCAKYGEKARAVLEALLEKYADDGVETIEDAKVQPVLKAAGYRVKIAGDGHSAISGVIAHDPDLVLLDLGLPDMDGKEVIRVIRKSSQVPIIVVSARHQEAEKIAALDEGADDYVNKPFEIGELMARMRVAVRRYAAQPANAAVFRGGPLKIDFARREGELMGEPVKLSPKEYMLLHALARRGVEQLDGRLAVSPRLHGIAAPEA